jgi:Ca2+-transporting ATPase
MSLPKQAPWHTQNVNQTIDLLKSDPDQGITTQEAKQRLHHYGPNEIEETSGRSNWEILLDQFKNIMLLMLIVVAIISGILDVIEMRQGEIVDEIIPFKDTIAILLIVILNGVLGYLQESRAEKALAALKKLSSPKVRVIRNGITEEIKGPKLVPGDIILLEAGVQLCADGQIIEASNLQVRESALTGEAEAVNKHTETKGLTEDTPLGDRLNMVFTGTEVVQGRAKVIVTETGMDTELGKIARMLQAVENEPTPLQQRMSHLGNILVSGSLILVALVVTIGLLQAGNFSPLQNLLEISLSMAVAVVPEGLPAVITVTLALGTQRMVKRHALIRKLPAVETLGSVDTICSDKTGTLTQNKMVVQEVQTISDRFTITGEGYIPVGEFINSQQEKIITQDYQELQALLISCLICNDALLCQETNKNSPKQSEWNILGDPTEGALLALAGKAELEQETLNNQFERIKEIPFSSERKRMSVICKNPNYSPIGDTLGTTDYLVFTKGSPEIVLEHCQSYQQGTKTFPLTEKQRQQIIEDNNKMASRGLRVLGFAYKPLAEINQDLLKKTAEKEMIWLGLTGMIDAPRSEVKLAVKKCRAAGIRPIMITGDHQLTARAIAQQLGITTEQDLLLTGQELEKMSQVDLESEVDQVSIYARVSPEHKLRIVKALQKRGKFVAMTGDGVNDAPALKQADIGIAMGITGTDVSKEASDMILLDDNFATIVAATEEGRVVYSNIRRFIKYILGSNIGEVITIAAAPILGLSGVPLTPLQILWMNLVTDGLPALALAMEPADPDIMKQPPFSPKESIFARGLGSYIIRIGIIFAIISISLMMWSYTESQEAGHPENWKTMVFTTLCIAQMGHALAVRSDTRSVFEMNPFSNLYLLGAVILTIVFQLMLIYLEPLRNFFDTNLLTRYELIVCLMISCLMFVWVELEKLFIRFFLSKKIK